MSPILSPLASRLSPRRRARRDGAFALLIVITLLAFIVLLLLGLAVFTRIEGAVAGNTQRQAQARENALLALNVAVGQLQRYAGPDTRVTATGEKFGPAGVRHLTGVWDTATSGTTALTWLVSGSEKNDFDPDTFVASAPNPATNPASTEVLLVGNNSVAANPERPTAEELARRIKSTLEEIKVSGVPGRPPAEATTIGRYAWWVGDQGVKAPVALPDTASAATFAPYDSAEVRRRIRQQIPIGAGAADGTSGTPIFEPADSNNAGLVANQKVNAFSQLAFLRTAANAQVGLTRLRQNLHTWSPNNFAVLANTLNGGLRQDLSLNPAALGEAFAAWVDYSSYMEPPVPAATPPPTVPPGILPDYSSDPIRRRYLMTPHTPPGGSSGSHQVGPILTYFLLTFNVRTQQLQGGNPSPLEIRARWMVSLWNPYSASLIPENLRIDIEGLPTDLVIVNEDPLRAGPLPPFSVHDAFRDVSDPNYDALRIALPWDAVNVPAGVPVVEDRQSWLPGRVYTWRSLEDMNKTIAPPPSGFSSEFYSRTLSAAGGGVQREINNGVSVIPTDLCHLEVGTATQLRITLYVDRPSGPVRIGRFVSPEFLPFVSSTQAIGAAGYQFSYVFRLAESFDTPATPSAWLTTPNIDPRRSTLPSDAFVVEALGNRPEQYENYSKIGNPDRLLDRDAGSWSYNEDVPLFELPRAPLLSVGSLQHFRIRNSRPFMIGNAWGATEQLNSIPLGQIFDRFFFSGLANGVVPDTTSAGDLILPNALLKPLRKPDQSKVTHADIQALMNPPVVTDANGNVLPGPAPTAASSKYFLQGGAFNLNSTQPAAWTAVLRGVRFPTAQTAFTYMNADAATGTADDSAIASVSSSPDAQFFRFSQSAQETYKAEPGQADNDPNTPSAARTELFRRGMRTLSGSEVAALAGRIVALVAVKHQDSGPFRSLEEFLAPSALFAGIDASGNPAAPRSLLEAAIEDAGINAAIPEFSSQWLTQADVMTSLAPVLFSRSDTFVIRTYGEAVNPATNAVEGRAWAEAIVQRVPEYFADPLGNPPETDPAAFDALIDPNDPASGTTLTQQLNKTLGRRFKVVSFRWLTRADI